MEIDIKRSLFLPVLAFGFHESRKNINTYAVEM